jgi:hypothetical protein
MKRAYSAAAATVTAACVLTFALPSQAQDIAIAPREVVTHEQDPADPHSISVGLHQDPFFGFYATATGTYHFRPEFGLSYYTIMWTRPGFGAGGTGANLWTEFGGGVNLVWRDLSVTPQVGLLNGSLLSGGEGGIVADGIVPNLTATYAGRLLEGEFYLGYYIALRQPRANDFLHYWVNAGVRALAFLSVGLHYEQLIHTRGGAQSMDSLYNWIGPYMQFTAARAAVRFAAGADFADTGRNDFYKVSVVSTF